MNAPERSTRHERRLWACGRGEAPVRLREVQDFSVSSYSALPWHEFFVGTIGAAAFRRLLHDERFAHCAFIAETPVDAPGDEARNVGVLRALAAG